MNGSDEAHMVDFSQLAQLPNEKDRPRCLHPWQALLIDAAGKVQPCGFRGNYTNTENAEPLGDINSESIAEIWNGETARRVRHCMAAGDLVGAGCGSCLAIAQGHSLGLQYHPNSGGDDAYSQNMRLKFEDIIEKREICKSKPTIVFYTPAHHCNLRCIHCYQNTTRRMHVKEDPGIIDLLPVLDEIVPGGGEPLIIPLWRRLLQTFDPEINPYLRLTTTTNATILLPEVMTGLQHFNRLSINVSIDGIGSTFEAIRKRADWPTVLQNAVQLRELVRAKEGVFAVSVSVMKQNMHQLADLLDLANELGGLINLQPVVTYPVDCSFRCFNLPPEDWPSHLANARLAARRLVESRSSTPDDLSANDKQVLGSLLGLLDAINDLIPWSILAGPHYRNSFSVPLERRPTVDFLRGYARHMRWDREDVVVVFAEAGASEPHWFAVVNEDYSFEVSLPPGSFTCWLIQIDSVPLNAEYFQAQNATWTIEHEMAAPSEIVALP
jgi:MoaA/NifB/PqqE/SkfB family radical SAM enzyme